MSAPNSGQNRMRVVVAILSDPAEDLTRCLESLKAQDYPIERVVAISTEESPQIATSPTMEKLVNGLDSGVEVVWILHGDAYPRPDALSSLVAVMERHQADVVGSKLLQADFPEQLDSVGAATDVYGEPYTGLDPEEVDLEQYDVVRDVAYVLGVSMLVRRDLLRGLKGLNSRLPPSAAGLDFSQRARLAGGRVMVAPSSEVLHAGVYQARVGEWKEAAGRVQAMLVAYRWLTLFWLIPVGTGLYFIDALVQLAWGRGRPLGRWLTTLGWNLWYLPFTIAARISLRPLRVVGDEELFRYQVSGSVRLRERVDEISDRFAPIAEDGSLPTDTPADRFRFPIIPILAVLVLVISTRALWWEGIPLTGFSLPFSSHPGGVISSYAGGWNPTGLGSIEPIHPSAVLAAISDLAVAGWGNSEALVTVLALLAGMVGMVRLLARWGLASGACWTGALTTVLGPFVIIGAEAGSWATLVGLSTLPWAIDAALSPWPGRFRTRMGRIGVMILAMGPPVLLVPWSVLIPPLVGLVLFLSHSRAWTGLLRSFIPSLAGLVLSGAYWIAVRPERMFSEELVNFSAGGISWWGGWWLVVAVVGVLAATASAGKENPAGWGVGLVGVAAAAMWWPDTGTEIDSAALLLASIGVGLVVGGVFETGYRWSGWMFPFRMAAWLGSLLILASTFLAAVDGQAHLPASTHWSNLDFAAALGPDSSDQRILLISATDALPGQARAGEGYWYRLVAGTGVSLEQGLLPQPGPGDLALSATLNQIISARDLRPGEKLAPFAVRWLVVSGDTPFQTALSEQVDLVPLPISAELSIYENPLAYPRVASSRPGSWEWEFAQASGPPHSGTVRVSEQYHSDWQPTPRLDGWAMEMSAQAGQAAWATDQERRWAAWSALGLAVIGLGLVIWGWGSRE